jgi:hypothetical protein
MGEMTREHLEAVRDAIDRTQASQRQWEQVACAVAPYDSRRYYEATGHIAEDQSLTVRLSEVAAMIEAKLESRDD